MKAFDIRALLAEETARMLLANGVISKDCETDAIANLAALPIESLIEAFDSTLVEYVSRGVTVHIVREIYLN